MSAAREVFVTGFRRSDLLGGSVLRSHEGEAGLLTPSELRALAARLGVVPTKKLGQNFVHDAGTVRKIVRLAGVGRGDAVLEVGPGLGSLTLALLESGAEVTAVEIDRVLARALTDTVAQKMGDIERLTVVLGDGMEVQPENLAEVGAPQPTNLVANLPYNVSVPIIFHILAEFPTLTGLLVMVQREVADRLVADMGTKTYGAPTVKLSWYGEPRFAGVVGPNVFWPKPNVDSALVTMDVVQNRLGDATLREATFEVVDAAFKQRRKMLRASLRQLFSTPEATSTILSDAGVEGTLRAEQLGIDEYVSIARAATATGWEPGQ